MRLRRGDPRCPRDGARRPAPRVAAIRADRHPTATPARARAPRRRRVTSERRDVELTVFGAASLKGVLES